MIIGAAEVRKTIEGIVKKGFTIAIWVFVIEYGPAETFMLVAGPIITVGTYMSDLILNAVAQTLCVFQHACPDFSIPRWRRAGNGCWPA